MSEWSAHAIWLKILPILRPRAQGALHRLEVIHLGMELGTASFSGDFGDDGPHNARLGRWCIWAQTLLSGKWRCALLSVSGHPSHRHQGAAPGCASQPHFLFRGSTGGEVPRLAQGGRGCQAAPATVPLGLAGCLHIALGLRTPVPPRPHSGQAAGGLEASPRPHGPLDLSSSAPRPLEAGLRPGWAPPGPFSGGWVLCDQPTTLHQPTWFSFDSAYLLLGLSHSCLVGLVIVDPKTSAPWGQAQGSWRSPFVVVCLFFTVASPI